MSFPFWARDIYEYCLDHMIRSVESVEAINEPFGHFYLTNVLPPDVFERLLNHLPDPSLYAKSSDKHYAGELRGFVRTSLELTTKGLMQLSAGQELWRGVAAAFTARVLKETVFRKLATDLSYRFGVPNDQVADLSGFSRPTLYRETEGFEIPPHPDTRKKVVTMHLYLPADLSQIGLGTTLYRRRMLALPVGDWHHRFVPVKQFEFRPNSCYAFVVNNTLMKRSWHGRERLPEGCGVRNTLLNTFYSEPRAGFVDYLPEEVSQELRAA